MDEELLETVPEQAPVNEVAKQKYQLHQVEAIGEVGHILEGEDKDIVEEALDSIAIIKEPVDDIDAKDSFNEYVHEIVSENDDKNKVVLDNFQTEQ